MLSSAITTTTTQTAEESAPGAKKQSEQLIICTQGNEAWYMGAPHGKGEMTEFLSMLPVDFVNKIKSNNVVKKPATLRASAKFITTSNVSVFEDLAKYSKDEFWSDIFTKITRGVNRKGFKFYPSSGDGDVAGRLVYKIKISKSKETFCDVPYNMKEAYAVVTNFMQNNGGIVSYKDSERMLKTINEDEKQQQVGGATTEYSDDISEDASEEDQMADDAETVNSVSTAAATALSTRKNYLKSGTTRLAIVNSFVRQVKNTLDLTRSEECGLKALISLITTSVSLYDAEAMLEGCDTDDMFSRISNVAWDPSLRKFIIIPKFISRSIFDNRDNVIMVLNRDKLSRYKEYDMISGYEGKKTVLSKIAIKKTKDIEKVNVTVNNLFITSIIEIVESYLLFMKYVMMNVESRDAAKDNNIFRVSREFSPVPPKKEALALPQSLAERELAEIHDKIRCIILTPMAAITCIILNGVEHEQLSAEDKKTTYKTISTEPAEFRRATLHKIVNFIPTVMEAFVAAYPDMAQTPFDMLKTILVFKYNVPAIITPALYAKIVDEILENPKILHLFDGDATFLMLVRSCANNAIVKIMKQILKNSSRESSTATGRSMASSNSFHRREGFDCTTTGLGSKRWAKMVKKL